MKIAINPQDPGNIASRIVEGESTAALVDITDHEAFFSEHTLFYWFLMN